MHLLQGWNCGIVAIVGLGWHKCLSQDVFQNHPFFLHVFPEGFLGRSSNVREMSRRNFCEESEVRHFFVEKNLEAAKDLGFFMPRDLC